MLKIPFHPKKNTSTLLCVLIMGVILLTLTGCSALKKIPFLKQAEVAPCPGLKIGVLIGAEGDALADEQRDGYELALAEANADGGPASCPLTLVYLPEEASGSSNQVYQAVRSLVEEQQVVAVLGGTSSSASMLAATLINRFSVPMLIPNTSSMTALPENNYWTFRVSADDEMYSQAVFDKIKTELGEEKTIAILFEDTSAGHDAAVTAAKMAGEQGYTVVQYSALDASQSGASLVNAWLDEETPPDVFYLILNEPEQALGLIEALNKVRAALPLTFVQGNGFVSQALLESSEDILGKQTGQMLAVTSWEAQASEDDSEDTFLTAFARYTAEKYGAARQPTPHSAMAYNSLRILQMTIRSGSAAWNAATAANVAAAREALRTDLQAYREVTPAWGTITFTTGGQNQAEVYIGALQAIPEVSLISNQEGHLISML